MKAAVKDVMSTHVIAVRKSASIKEIAAKRREYGVTAFPVLNDDDTVTGVISEADLLAKDADTAGDLMTHPAATVRPDEPVELVAQIRRVEGVVAVRDRLSYLPPGQPASPGPLF